MLQRFSIKIMQSGAVTLLSDNDLKMEYSCCLCCGVISSLRQPRTKPVYSLNSYLCFLQFVPGCHYLLSRHINMQAALSTCATDKLPAGYTIYITSLSNPFRAAVTQQSHPDWAVMDPQHCSTSIHDDR